MSSRADIVRKVLRVGCIVMRKTVPSIRVSLFFLKLFTKGPKQKGCLLLCVSASHVMIICDGQLTPMVQHSLLS
jgi:hypothetical protein